LVTVVALQRAEDSEVVRAVNHEAFGQPHEGQLVGALRTSGGVLRVWDDPSYCF